MFLLGAMLAASLLYTPELSYGVDKVARFWAFGVLGLALGLGLSHEERSREGMLRGFAVVGAILALLGVARLASQGIDHQLAVLGGGPNVYVRVLFFGLLSATALSAVSTDRRVAAFWGGVSVLHLVPMLFTGSRGGMIAALAALACIALVAWCGRPRSRTLGLWAIALLAVLGIFGLWLPAQFPELFGAASRYRMLASELPGGMSLSARLEAARLALAAFQSHPALGLGAGGFASLHALRYPHNLVLEALSEIGAVGMGLLVTVGLLVLQRLLRVLRRGAPAGIGVVVVGWALGLLVFGFVSAQFSGDFGDSRFLWFAAGLVAGVGLMVGTASSCAGTEDWEGLP
jgi:hypothetical protein